MNAQLTTIPKTQLVQQNNALWTPEEEKHIKEYYAKGANEQEWKHFLFIATERKLDPRLNQFYFIKYGGKASFVTGIDGYRLIAHRTGRLDSIETMIRREGEELYGVAWVYVKGSHRPFKAEAALSEYKAPNNPMWQKMPQQMIKKCAEALALRMAFPQDLSGLYTQEEMDQAERPARPERVITEESTEDKKAKATAELKAMIDTIQQLRKEHNVTDEQFEWATNHKTLKGKSFKEIEQVILELNAWVNRDKTEEQEDSTDFIDALTEDTPPLDV